MQSGVCYRDLPICYGCGIWGHIQRDFRLSRQNVGRGMPQPASLTATTSIAPPPARDLGSTLSYVTPYVAIKYGIEPKKLHEPSSVSTPFTTNFWQKYQQGLGTQVNLSTVFHPQTDEQVERTILTLEDILCSCVLDFKGSCDDHFPLIEFAYNNSYHTSIQMASFKALYGRRCKSPIYWFDLGEAEFERARPCASCYGEGQDH
ncbi:uncharacterized protein [Nicotiana tomentosiformis]|uniref:uncharacterized protein n=1 Tax=Nicotiana tomentosiformis TaxID=4098 RepID=UPI00388C492F